LTDAIPPQDAPRWDAIRLAPQDTVATALRPLQSGAVPRVVDEAGTPVAAPALTAAIPRGHKFALQAIAAGDHVMKYGAPIGPATAAIAAGAHVHLHNLEGYAGRAARRAGQDAQ